MINFAADTGKYLPSHVYFTIIDHLPMRGTDSEVAGTSSAISSMNIENARKTERPKLIFSPGKEEHSKVR